MSEIKQPPVSEARRQVSAYKMVLTAVVVVVNAALLSLAWTDHSWGALGVAIMFGPIANVVIALVSIVSLLIFKSRLAPVATESRVLYSIFLPLAAVVFDFFFILYVVQPSGC